MYSFLLFFRSFPLNIFVSLIFIALSPNWHLALVLFSSLCFRYCHSDRHNFGFPLFAESIYCTLSWFCLWVYMYICILSHTFYCGYKPLHLHWAFGVLWRFPFYSFFLSSLFRFFLFSFIILTFNVLESTMFFLHLFLCLPFLLFFSPYR